MLCSRDFVYHSEASAKGRSNHGMHNHCDCIIVPGVKGVTKIQGYDPESMKKRWEECRKTCGSNKRRDIIRKCETRDPKWLYRGEAPKVSYDNDEIEKEILRYRAHELEAATVLSKHGIKCRFCNDREEYVAENGIVNYIGLPDLDNGYEIKTLKTATSLGRVDKHIHDASKKKGLVCCVIDNQRGNFDDGKVLEAMEGSMKTRGVKECLLIRSDKSIARLW